MPLLLLLIMLLMAWPLCSSSTGSEKKSEENGSDDEDDADEPFICSSSEVMDPPPVGITGVVSSTVVSNVGPGSMLASMLPSMLPPDTLLKMKCGVFRRVPTGWLLWLLLTITMGELAPIDSLSDTSDSSCK